MEKIVQDLELQLQHYISELRVSNEELNMLNEEFQASNEELSMLNEELHTKNNRLEELSLLATHSHELVLMTDQYQRILWVNSAFERLTEYTLEEVRGKKPNLLQGKDTDPRHMQAMREGIRSLKPFSQEILNYSKSGKPYWLLVSITPIFNPEGKLIKFIAVELEITRQKENQLQLAYQNESLKQFSYIVSHNLRSNAANIMGLLSLVDINQIGDTETLGYLAMLNEQAQQLDHTIRELNEVLMLRGEVATQMAVFQWQELIETALIDFQLLVQALQIEIKVQIDSPTVKGVKAYLKSMLYNLISNAIKYRQPQKVLQIEIKTYNLLNLSYLSIKDNGIGVDVGTNKNYIFGMYKRVSSHIEGRGVGLFITKAQIEAMGGRIDVEGKLGEGTEFVVCLPKK